MGKKKKLGRCSAFVRSNALLLQVCPLPLSTKLHTTKLGCASASKLERTGQRRGPWGKGVYDFVEIGTGDSGGPGKTVAKRFRWEPAACSRNAHVPDESLRLMEKSQQVAAVKRKGTKEQAQARESRLFQLRGRR